MKKIFSVFYVLFFLFSSCQEDRMFAPCTFDNETKKACHTDDFMQCINLTCAIPDHPECIDMICLSYEGASPKCTRECNPDADDCPSGSKCVSYTSPTGEQSFACVKIEDMEGELFKDCSLNSEVCKEYSADICADFKGEFLCTKKCENVCGNNSACQEFNGKFYCLKSCKQDISICSSSEVCIEYKNNAYCFPKCPKGATDCVAQGGVSYFVPDDLEECNPHAGCPGRSYCMKYEDLGYYCFPCDYATSLF